MMRFQHYVNSRDFNEQDQQPPAQQTSSLDKSFQSFMSAFNQEFQKDPQSSLTWLNNLYTQMLPEQYQQLYAQWQKGNQQPPQQQQQQQQKNNQQSQPPQNQQQPPPQQNQQQQQPRQQ
jgi:hypothetical protein